MGLTAVVDNLRAFKKTVKKPIAAFRETVHNAYTRAYVGSPERVDEFYEYIKVYQRSSHNDLCMMSITADINRFSMIPDKRTFFHVLKLERHFDRMILGRGVIGVTGDMGIQILSGHNMSFMSRYRRYKTRAAEKEAKRNEKRHKALNVKRHTQLSTGEGTDVFGVDAKKVEEPEPFSDHHRRPSDDDTVLLELSKEMKEVALEVEDHGVEVVCELTKPETVVVKADVKIIEEKNDILKEATEMISFPAKSKLDTQKKNPIRIAKQPEIKKFKVAKPLKNTVKKEERSKQNIEDVMEQMSLEEQHQRDTLPGTSDSSLKTENIIHQDTDKDDDEYDNLSTSSDSCDSSDSDSDSDGSDIEEIEKIEERDVDALEYEMI